MPTRVAFVGPSTSSDFALHAPAGDLLPRFFDVRGADADAAGLRGALEAWGAQVVVVFDPGCVAPGSLSGMRALRLGFLTEPVGRPTVERPELRPERTPEITDADRGNFDRVASADPLVAGAWRSFPPPVDDRLFADVRPSATPPRAVFVGPSTAHRERFLINAKHEYDLLHYAHGLYGDRLREVFAKVDVGLSLYAEPFPCFPPGPLRHLAAGHLLISEPLAPTHGLEPGLDFFEIIGPDDLMTALHQMRRRPDTFERLRHRGREKAEDYRASRVWPRLLSDLGRDVAAFGRARLGSPSTTRS